MKIIIDKTKSNDNVILAWTNHKTKEVEVDCDNILDNDELFCECGQSYGKLKDLIYPKIIVGSFMQNIMCGNCKKSRRFFFWSYFG